MDRVFRHEMSYTLYLRVCEKSGTRILVAGFEADKKSFVSVPVSSQK